MNTDTPQMRSVLSTCILFCFFGINLYAQVSGTVFQDYNANGTQDNTSTLNETGIEGITVTGYGVDETVYGPVTTSADGTYLLTGINQPSRIEFTWEGSWLQSGPAGGSAVQFVNGPSTNIDFGVVVPADFCEEKPNLFVPCYVLGNQTSGPTSTYEVLIEFGYDSTLDDPHQTINLANQVGSVWGLANQNKGGRLFAAAFHRRHSGFGPGGIAAIYEIDPATNSATVFLDLESPSYFGTGFAGNDPHPTSTDANDWLRDIASYPLVGKISFGDLDISEDEKTLYTINLATNELISIPLGSLLTPVPPPKDSIIITTINPTLPDCPGAGDFRPFGLGIRHGKIYIGAVCSGESQVGSWTDPAYPQAPYDVESYTRAYVFEFDPQDPGSGFIEKLNFDLDFRYHVSDFGDFYDNYWGPWGQEFPAGVDGDLLRNMQPMLVDIEFDGNDMILGFRDRFGDQLGMNAYGPDPADDNQYRPVAFGDVLRACYDGNNNWTLESNGSCGGDTVNNDGDIPRPPEGGVDNQEGPFGGEWYWGDYHFFDFDTPTTHLQETVMGGMIQIPGVPEVIVTVVDPIDQRFEEGGVRWLTNLTGAQEDSYVVYQQSTDPSDWWGKANGLGDLETLCGSAPIEIGNRVWNDLDGDGIQDPGEPGIESISVELLDGTGTLIGTAITDANGNYLFSNSNSGPTSSFVHGLNLNYQNNYTLRIPDAEGPGQQAGLSGLEVTLQNNDPALNGDSRDADGSITTHSEISLSLGDPGENNHTYDFGFKAATPPPPCSLNMSYVQNTCIDNGNGTFTTTYDLILNWASPPATGGIYLAIAGDGTLNTSSVSEATISGGSATTLSAALTVPADGSGTTSVVALFDNATTCTASVSFKAPLPCPGDATSCTGVADELGGLVWEDWNYDGNLNESDVIGVPGIEIMLYDCSGNLIGTTYTDEEGEYIFDAGNTDPDIIPGEPYRVEFYLPESVNCWAQTTTSGNSSTTNIQIVYPGDCANMGVASPSDYCQTNPPLVTSCYINGDTNDPGVSGRDALVSFLYDGTNKTVQASAGEVGSTWGIAHDQNNQRYFISTVLKRHTGIADDLGTIYLTDPISATPSVFTTLSNVGSVPSNADRGLTDLSSPSQDQVVFGQIGKAGIGDIDISEDGQTLYAVNLNTRSVVAIDIATKSETELPPFPEPGCNLGVARPWGLKVYKGNIYLGVVCSGENGGGQSDLSAHVFSYNSGSWINILSFGLDYSRGCSYDFFGSTTGCNGWNSWYDDDSSMPPASYIFSGAFFSYPSPILSDIEFTEDGSMLLGFIDRSGMQFGDDNLSPDNDGTLYSYVSGGDILKAHFLDNSYIIENNGLSGEPVSAGQNNNQGPGGGEFIFQDSYIDATDGDVHNEVSFGGIALLKGRGEAVLTRLDPDALNSGGIGWFDTDSGLTNRIINLYTGELPDGFFGKSIGLGDVELLCNPAPVEIGNYIWADLDEDGIQDPCEPGLPGVTISLYADNGSSCCGVPDSITSIQTNAEGYFVFNDSLLAAVYGISNTDTTGLLLPNSTYYIVLGEGQWNESTNNLNIGGQTYLLTTANAIQAGHPDSDLIDSDGTIGESACCFTDLPYIPVNTGAPGTMSLDHSFGFLLALGCPSIAFNSSSQVICDGDNIDSLVVGITTVATPPDTIRISYFTTPNSITSVYDEAGTELGQLITSTRDTASLLSPALPAHSGGATNDTLFVYAYWGNTPTDPSCRPIDSMQIVITPSVTATLSPTAFICNNSGSNSTILDLSTLITSGDTTGTWTDTDGTGVSLSDPANVDFDGILPGIYTFTYTTAAAAAPCTNAGYTTEVTVFDCSSGTFFDWGDLPDLSPGTAAGDYQTTSANGGPAHQIIPGLYLGGGVDNETNGQPSTDALGDGNDEDGVSFLPSLNIYPGITINLPLSVNNATASTAYLEAWIDWNGDGDFDDADEMVADFDDSGTNFPSCLTITVPGTAALNQLLGFRIRLSHTDNMSPYGFINSGEIEDYLVRIDCPTLRCLPIQATIIKAGFQE